MDILNKSGEPIDESLYSRQMYVLGHEAMNSMRKKDILISGLGGVGIELAKCIILAGVRSVTIHDNKNIKLEDLSTQYYFTEKDINKNRTLCIDKLKELNPYVEVIASTDNLKNLITIKRFDVVVLTSNTLVESKEINQLTREMNIKFILCNAYGCFGNIFCDFGINFIINDVDGEELRTGIVANISYDTKVIETMDPHNLSEGDIIKLSNGQELKVQTIEGPRKFTVSKFVEKNNTGLTFQQIKHPKMINFKSLSESLIDPKFMDIENRPLHAIYRGLDIFYTNNNRLPKPWNNDDAVELYEITSQVYLEVDKDIVYRLSYTVAGQLCPLSSLIGSIGAQEVMKACSGKFHPIHQWFYYDIITSLPTSLPANKPTYNRIKDRYYGQRMIYGDVFQEKLSKSTVFIVGAGAIGCEHLKNFALMGIGNIIITDMDNIEKSNLNRQFLFRSDDIGKSKSEIAVREIRKMNPLINVTAHLNKVCTDTENIYNENFYQKVTCVANALDNVQSRIYIDEKCITYCKPLLEAGTEGIKGNVQAIIPYLTESYSSMTDPVVQAVPLCTLKNFPYLIEHCIQYSRDLFEGYFVQAPTNVIKYLSNKELLLKMTVSEAINIINDIKKVIRNKPESYEDCIKYAYNEWHELYKNQILQLITNHPIDSKTKDGEYFWSGTKRCPKPLSFDDEDDICIKFIESFANLWADIYGLKSRDIKLKDVIKGLIPNNVDTISINLEDTDLVKMVESLPEIKVKIYPLTFDKDDDTNHQIDFISATTNLRAMNYGIKKMDRFTIKRIAGKIIPAIATSTSLVSSLVALEMYKIISDEKDISKYRNSFFNLAIPLFSQTEPMEATKFRLVNKEYTFWDSIKFNDVKLGEIIKYYHDEYGVDVDDITVGQARFYSVFLPNNKRNERLDKKVSEIYYEINMRSVQSPIIMTMISYENELPNCYVYF